MSKGAPLTALLPPPQRQPNASTATYRLCWDTQPHREYQKAVFERKAWEGPSGWLPHHNSFTPSENPFLQTSEERQFSAQRRLPYSLTFQRNTSEPVRYAASIEQMWYRLRAVRRCPVYVLRYGVSGLEILNLCEKCIAWEFEQTTVFNQMRVCLKCAVCSAATLTQKYDFYRGLARSRVWDLVSRGLVFW